MNSKIKIYLDRLASSPKQPNSYLFFGPDGAVKIEAAFCLIRKVSGKDRDKEFSRRAEEGLHPDVIILEPETVKDKKGRIREKEISISQVREMQERIRFFPYELKYKFCLIKKAERLNTQAQNSLLKILEEPTESTFFILLADDIGSVLPTISSRCAALRFLESDLPKWKAENRERFRKIFTEEIYEKFDYIEKIAKDKNELLDVLKDWEAVAGEGLRKLTKRNQENKEDEGNFGKIKKVVRLVGEIREAINQLERTNASPRAVGERLVLGM